MAVDVKEYGIAGGIIFMVLTQFYQMLKLVVMTKSGNGDGNGYSEMQKQIVELENRIKCLECKLGEK
jgi:hypothetical protein